MNKSILKKNIFLNIINNSIIMLPTPINISLWWNLGSTLGLCLLTQIISGLLLSFHYCPNINLSFNSIIHIMQDINIGWLTRLIHMNGASMFFICMYMHIGRGMYYGSYTLMGPWYSGTLIFLLSMASAFMGYVLPWGQMSFWGATVITNLISTIPYCGQIIVEWIWGGFAINNPTLNRFFSFHFITPLIIMMIVLIHLTLIHSTGSNNPLGLNSNFYKIPFHIYFTLKDLYGFIIMLFLLFMLNFLTPYKLSDPDNFMMATPMSTPPHIQPEWYFLFAYTILRAIPNKLGGVIALLMSILIMLIMPLISNSKFQNISFYPLNKIFFFFFFNNMIMLTWLGSCLIEPPFSKLSQIFTLLYFSYYFMSPLMMKSWDKFIFNI